MARLNWQKLATEQRQIQANSKANIREWQQKHRNHWTIGKHTGKHLRLIETNYLIWASENLKGDHKQKADTELRRRYNKLISTQG